MCVYLRYETIKKDIHPSINIKYITTFIHSVISYLVKCMYVYEILEGKRKL